MNSGPLSDLMWAGTPLRFMRRMSSSITSSEVRVALGNQDEALPGELVDDRKPLQAAPRSSRSKMKSQAQMWLGCSGRWRAQLVLAHPQQRRLCPNRGRSSLPASTGDRSFAVHPGSPPGEEGPRCAGSRSEGASSPGLHTRKGPHLVGRRARQIALGGSCSADHAAGSAFRYRKLALQAE